MADVTAKLMGLDKVTELLGCSIYSVRRYITLGSIKAVNIGSRIMVSSEEVARIQREGLAPIPLGRPRKVETAAAVPLRAGRATRERRG